jgi:hypothetical protein
MTELAKWESFYTIVGSAAGALIGLQFVVMTLITQRPRVHADAGAAFATPTIMHFSAALVLAALLRAPWQTIATASMVWGVVAFAGVVYAVVVIRRMAKQGVYRPVFEDWMFHAVLPLAAYATLAVSAVTAADYTREALFGVGGSVLLLLFIGIHNAWDAVTYHVFVETPKTGKEK